MPLFFSPLCSGAAAGMEYCAEHMDSPADRVPCPYDNGHTVFKHALQRHLRKCNARPRAQPTYYAAGYNRPHPTATVAQKGGAGVEAVPATDVPATSAGASLADAEAVPLIPSTLRDAPSAELLALIERVRQLAARFPRPMTEAIRQHATVEQEIAARQAEVSSLSEHGPPAKHPEKSQKMDAGISRKEHKKRTQQGHRQGQGRTGIKRRRIREERRPEDLFQGERAVVAQPRACSKMKSSSTIRSPFPSQRVRPISSSSRSPASWVS